MELHEIRMAPRKLSKVGSRSEDIDLKSDFAGLEVSMPIIASPMDTVASKEMALFLNENKILSTLHRFTNFEERLSNFRDLKNYNDHKLTFVSVGIHEFDEVDEFYNIGVRNFLVDTANGFNVKIEPIIKHIKSKPETRLIAGNVATKEGFLYLARLGVDAVRVGIGTGSVCTTSVMTGVGLSLPDSVAECYEAKFELASNKENTPLIIADGGISIIGDIPKILYWGADFVMIGRLLAGTKETSGSIIKHSDGLYMIYRGLASFAVQSKEKILSILCRGR